MTIKLDALDSALLSELAADPRTPILELASRLKVARNTVQARMKRLEELGVIAGYRAILDPVKMGQAHVAFVEVRLSDTREAALQAFNRAVATVAEIEQCHMIASSVDYLLKVRTRDIASYRKILGERISALPHIAQTSTFVAMETVKDR